jgi:hypothetical protein
MRIGFYISPHQYIDPYICIYKDNEYSYKIVCHLGIRYVSSETVGKYKYWNILENQWFYFGSSIIGRYFIRVFVDFFSLFRLVLTCQMDFTTKKLNSSNRFVNKEDDKEAYNLLTFSLIQWTRFWNRNRQLYKKEY